MGQNTELQGKPQTPDPEASPGPCLTRHICIPAHQASGRSVHTAGPEPPALLFLSLCATVYHLSGPMASGAHPRWVAL